MANFHGSFEKCMHGSACHCFDDYRMTALDDCMPSNLQNSSNVSETIFVPASETFLLRKLYCENTITWFFFN